MVDFADQVLIVHEVGSYVDHRLNQSWEDLGVQLSGEQGQVPVKQAKLNEPRQTQDWQGLDTESDKTFSECNPIADGQLALHLLDDLLPAVRTILHLD